MFGVDFDVTGAMRVSIYCNGDARAGGKRVLPSMHLHQRVLRSARQGVDEVIGSRLLCTGSQGPRCQGKQPEGGQPYGGGN